MMTCPACQGNGYRLLRIGTTEGLCPGCGGAGSVKETDQGQGEGGWTFKYVPCRLCSGRGIKPIKDGGVRIVLTSSAPPSGYPSDDRYDDSDVDEDEEADEDKEKSSGEESFISRYRTYLLVGGGALLVVALVASQVSKGNKR